MIVVVILDCDLGTAICF